VKPNGWTGALAITLLLAVLAVSAGAAGAQEAPRSGFWLEGGSGAGTVRSACSGCPVVTVAYGRSTHLRVGGAVSPHALLGFEVFALQSSELTLADGLAPGEAENGGVGPVVIWYVGPSGLFLKGGVGLARGTFTVQSAEGEPLTTERTGLAYTFGIGFDFGIARWLALTANLGSYVTAIGDVRVDGAVADDVIATVYEAAVGVTLR